MDVDLLGYLSLAFEMKFRAQSSENLSDAPIRQIIEVQILKSFVPPQYLAPPN